MKFFASFKSVWVCQCCLLRQHFMQREKTWIWSWSEWKTTSVVGDSDRHKHFTVYVECRVWWPLKGRDWLQVCLYASKSDSFYMKVLEQDMLLFCRDITHYPIQISPSLVFLRKSKAGRSLTGFETMKVINSQIFSFNATVQQTVPSSKYSACLNSKTNYTAEFVYILLWHSWGSLTYNIQVTELKKPTV